MALRMRGVDRLTVAVKADGEKDFIY